ncbi:MAG: S-layer homology domain-containing protein, partial [Hominilimicola sp.]
MGKKMKKLICALLASAMLVSSVGMVAFADADKDENAADTTATETVDTAENTDTADTVDEPEATEAPVETEAPAVTEAPAATEAPVVGSSAYDNDNYYQKSLALCSSLGIISGYEDGSVKPESKVTRAEMASIVLRMLAITSWTPYQNSFTDVTSAHWAADQIQTAQESGIISGMGDGTFVPDGDVTYAQVVVMLVNAMNYQDDANYFTNGTHWASGYMKAAASTDLDLLKNAPGELDVATDRGVVIKMVYNALLGQYREISGYENGGVTYSAKGTLAKAKFDVIDKKGILIGTSKTTIGNKDLSDGQIEIQEDKAEESEVFDCSLKDLEDYIAQKITYYYKQNSGKTAEVLAVTYDSSKSETYTINDVDDIESVTGFENNRGSIKVVGVSKAKDCT